MLFFFHRFRVNTYERDTEPGTCGSYWDFLHSKTSIFQRSTSAVEALTDPMKVDREQFLIVPSSSKGFIDKTLRGKEMM